MLFVKNDTTIGHIAAENSSTEAAAGDSSAPEFQNNWLRQFQVAISVTLEARRYDADGGEAME